MEIKTKHICPFGMAACERIVGDEIHRCSLYLEMDYKNTVTGESTKVSNCSLNWGVILQNEAIKGVLGVQEAVESSRNEAIKSTENVVSFLALAMNKKPPQENYLEYTENK